MVVKERVQGAGGRRGAEVVLTLLEDGESGRWRGMGVASGQVGGKCGCAEWKRERRSVMDGEVVVKKEVWQIGGLLV